MINGINCQALSKEITKQDCVRISMILGAKRMGSRCNGCTSENRVCPHCILQGEIKIHNGPKLFHFVQNGDACLFHFNYGAGMDRKTKKDLRDEQLAKDEKVIRRSSVVRRPRSSSGKSRSAAPPPEIPKWVKLRLINEPEAQMGHRVQVKPQEIYVPSVLPARQSNQANIARIRQMLGDGLQEELIYLSDCPGIDKQYRYSLVAGGDMVLVGKDFARCTMCANFVDVPSRVQQFLLALQLETYTDDEMRRALKEARDLHHCDEVTLAKILGEKISWIRKQISLA